MESRGVEELVDLLYACRGAWDTPDRSGDPVDLYDHALQTAALLRRSRAADKELQLAGLVHDIGHLLRPCDDAGHADHAADVVRAPLGKRVARLVHLHVPAKRHLGTGPRPVRPEQADPARPGRPRPGAVAGLDWTLTRGKSATGARKTRLA